MTKANPDIVRSPLLGPTGLGTSAARLLAHLQQAAGSGELESRESAATSSPAASPPAALEPTRASLSSPPPHSPRPSGDPAYALRPWGDGSHSPLYCPITERFNEPLAAEVDEKLAAWARECGFDEDEIAKIRKAKFGRLMMLCHVDCDDPDRLLIGAKLNASWWAADDYYADDSALGAVAELLPPRLVLAMAAMDPPPPAGEFTAPLDEAIRSERVLVALRSSVGYLARYGLPAQVQRVCYATFAMFVSWTAYAAWRHTDKYPPAWEYLAARQHDSFYTSMTLIDVIGGYELPANLYYEPRVRDAAFQAGTASVLLNDLYSVHKDLQDEKPPCNMVLQVAKDRGCSIDDATEIVVELHNEVVRDFEENHRVLQGVPNVELQRFVRGLRSWMGGGFEWHDSNPRYRTGAKQRAAST